MLWTNSEKDIIAPASSCRVCADKLPAGPKPIFSLHPQAKVALLSQAPGRIAHESGEAWKAPGGRRLRAWLGVSDESFFDPRNFAGLPLGLCATLAIAIAEPYAHLEIEDSHRWACYAPSSW